MTEARPDRRMARRRERRTRHQQDHVLRDTIGAMDAGEIADWNDEQEEGQEDGE